MAYPRWVWPIQDENDNPEMFNHEFLVHEPKHALIMNKTAALILIIATSFQILPFSIYLLASTYILYSMLEEQCHKLQYPLLLW